MLQLVISHKKSIVHSGIQLSNEWNIVKSLFTQSYPDRFTLQSIRTYVCNRMCGDLFDKKQTNRILKERVVLLAMLQDGIAAEVRTIDTLNAILWHQRTTAALSRLVNNHQSKNPITMNQLIAMLAILELGTNNLNDNHQKDRRQVLNMSQTKESSQVMYQPHTHIPIITRCKFV